MAAKKSSASKLARSTATKRSDTKIGPARPRPAPKAATTRSPSVVMQARVDQAFARALVEQDAVVLGLEGPSELVREGLRLVHERAREAAMISAYDDFYAGEPAPLPAGVVPAGVE
jgi:hypothetical protein